MESVLPSRSKIRTKQALTPNRRVVCSASSRRTSSRSRVEFTSCPMLYSDSISWKERSSASVVRERASSFSRSRAVMEVASQVVTRKKRDRTAQVRADPPGVSHARIPRRTAAPPASRKQTGRDSRMAPMIR